MLIVGAGAFALDLLSTIMLEYEAKDIVLFDHKGDTNPAIAKAFTVFTTPEQVRTYFSHHDRRYIMGIGDNRLREKMAGELEELGGENTSFISRHAVVGHLNDIHEKGVIILHHANITNDITIGEGAILYVNSNIGHQSKLGKYCLVSSLVCCSATSIGDYTSIGIGAVLKPGLTIGKHVQIGTGAVVTKDIADHMIVAGNPARVIGENTAG